MFTIQGTVIKGKQLGHQFGFPTVNVRYTEPIPLGIYAGKAITPLGTYQAAIFIGPDGIAEAFLIDFSEMLYDQSIRLEVIEKIRDIRTFSDLEQLRVQIEKDVAFIKSNFSL